MSTNPETTSPFAEFATVPDEPSPFAEFADIPEEAPGASPFARFAAGADGTTADAGETPRGAGEQAPKKKPLDPAKFRKDLLLHVLQFDTSVAVTGYVKAEKEDRIKKLVGQAADEFGTDQFIVKAPTIDGDEEEIAKVSVTRTKDETKLDNEKALTGWAAEHRPDLIETERRISPHIDPKLMEEVYAFILERDPKGVEEITKLKGNAVDMILAKSDVDGENITLDVETVDEETGEVGEPVTHVVPGLSFHKGGDVKGFTITHGGKGQPNQKKALRLLGERKITGVDMRELLAGAQAQLEAKK